MARFHDRLRDRIEALLAPESVEAFVVLSSVTGGAGSAAYNAEQAYAHAHGLDPALRIDDRTGGFGLVCALTPGYLHFLTTEGNMRSGTVEPGWTAPRDEVTIRHRRGGMPGARTRLFHVSFGDERYYLGSASESRAARNAVNDPRAFLEAVGPRAAEAEG